MFFWVLAAVRQYKTDLRWYFLIYAIFDPINLLFWNVSGRSQEISSIIIAYLLFLSVARFYKDKMWGKFLIYGISLLVLISFFVSRKYLLIFHEIDHLSIFFLFMIMTFKFVVDNNKLNISHLFLLLEEMSVTLKLTMVHLGLKASSEFFVSTSALEILIAIFFILYRNDDKRLFINLKRV
jgi:hypothetical protein